MAQGNKPVVFPFPSGGMDTFWAHRNQPLVSSPALLNVRPQTALNGRLGGGQRAGTKKAYSEELGSGGAVRMAGQITLPTLATTDSDDFNRVDDTTLGTGWTTAAWSTSGTESIRLQSDAAGMGGRQGKFGANYRTTTPDYVITSDYFMQVDILAPRKGKSVYETIHIYTRMGATPAIATDGLDAELLIDKTSSSQFTYSGNLICYVSGSVASTTAFSSAAVDFTALPMIFKIAISGNDVTVTFGGVDLIPGGSPVTVSAQSGTRIGIGMDRTSGSSNDPVHIDNYFFQATRPSTSDAQRRTILLASAGGSLYDEDDQSGMNIVAGDAASFSSDHSFQGVETSTGFYMADYAADRVAGTDGTIGGAGNDELTATGVSDWTTYGIDKDTDVVVISDPATGGPSARTYKISAVVSSKLTLATAGEGAIGTVAAAPTAGGTGYKEGDRLKVTQGTGAQVKVTDVSSGGVVTAVKLKAAGTVGYTTGTGKATTPTDRTIRKGGGGAGCTVNILTTTSGGACAYQVALGPKVYSVGGAVSIWQATAGRGSVPTSCRLLALYRNRLVLARPEDDPHNWFMARQDDPLDWDYGDTDAQAAVAGQNADAGKIGDAITALIPYSDDYLLFGALHSIWRLSGDPAEGGRIDSVSYKTGILGAQAWTFDPSGNLYFMGQEGFFMMAPGGQPLNLSETKLPRELADIDTDIYEVFLVWSRKQRGVSIYLTPVNTAATVHWFYHAQSKSFWRDQIPDVQGPTMVWDYQAEAATRSVVILGGRDGYLRTLDADEAGDDGTAIDSYVVFAPQAFGGPHEAILQKLDIAFTENTNTVDWQLKTGRTFEAAVDATALYSGTFNSGGLQYSLRRRVRGMALCLRLGNDTLNESWAFEEALGTVALAGPRRRP